MFPHLTLVGTPHEMGRQHARQIRPLRTLLMEAFEARLAEVRVLGADAPSVVAEAQSALAAHDRPLLDFLAGLADELALPPADLLTYTLGSYLLDLYKVTQPVPPIMQQMIDDGCTTWAAAAPWTAGDGPLLAKNRDFRQDHIALQILCTVQPAAGYRYLCLGSAGSPHVYSSGINERGLAIADTHVLSADLGPGVPRSSLMRTVLEQHDTTQSALDYLRSVPHMGGGTLILADAQGDLAVCESGNAHCGFLTAGTFAAPQDGSVLASTNHFVTAEMAAAWIEDEPPMLIGNSQARRARVLAALERAKGVVDANWARQMMGAHGSLQDAICRHARSPDDQLPPVRMDSSTISSVIYLPRGAAGKATAAPSAWLINGQPCGDDWVWERLA